ncbi:MAG: hypothetical protein SynsKO_39480 [Synoicihabitans sp.]
MATERVEIEKTIRVDERDDQPQLIKMTGEHQNRISLGVQSGYSVSQCIFFVNVGSWFDVFVESRLSLRFVTRGGSGIKQVG